MDSRRIDQIYLELKETYPNLFIYSGYSETPIFYKPLTRAEYYALFEDESLLDVQREDIICINCIVYPKNIDISEMPAGIVSDIAKKVMDISFMSKEGRRLLYESSLAKMSNIDRQLSCIIHEAFPEYDIEDIDNWDMIKTMDFLLRSEWILKNIKGQPGLDIQEIINRTHDIDLAPQDPRILNEEREYYRQQMAAKQPEKHIDDKPKEAPKKRQPRRKKQQMSEEELRRMFPEAFTNVGDESSFKDMAMSTKNPTDMTMKELAELQQNRYEKE